MIPQAALQLARFCQEAGINHLVISPGSRSAPLVLSLNRIGGLTLHKGMDERSAGFLALGLAIGLQKPIGLVCTSGTALLNYGPAIAEAFYQQVPLLIFSADRPPESIDQWDGQAIRQNGVFSLHTKFWAEMPSLDESEVAKQFSRHLLNKAFSEATAYPNGPVHLNFPFREPLYPNGNIDFSEFENKRIRIETIGNKTGIDPTVMNQLAEEFRKSGGRMVLIGQNNWDLDLRNSLHALAEYGQVVIAGDVLKNISEPEAEVNLTDWFPEQFLVSNNSPELLITAGKGVLSKKLKDFLKRFPPKIHWHICEAGYPSDPLGTITRVIHCKPSWFLSKLAEITYFQNTDIKPETSSFRKSWTDIEAAVKRKLGDRLSKEEWSDFVAVDLVLNKLEEHSNVFIGNSMPIRYVNAMQSNVKSDIHFFANRGTSGIDGCISTALGIAISQPKKPLVAIVGDMSFIYDRNGLWGQKLPDNLKILVLNNGGGNIFRILPGSGNQPELEELFEMNQPLSAKTVAEEAGMAYFSISEKSEATDFFSNWLSHPTAALLECFTDKYINHQVFKNCKSACYEL